MRLSGWVLLCNEAGCKHSAAGWVGGELTRWGGSKDSTWRADSALQGEWPFQRWYKQKKISNRKTEGIRSQPRKKGETTEFNVTLSVSPKLMYFVTLHVDRITQTSTLKPFSHPFHWKKSKASLIGLVCEEAGCYEWRKEGRTKGMVGASCVEEIGTTLALNAWCS